MIMITNQYFQRFRTRLTDTFDKFPKNSKTAYDVGASKKRPSHKKTAFDHTVPRGYFSMERAVEQINKSSDKQISYFRQKVKRVEISLFLNAGEFQEKPVLPNCSFSTSFHLGRKMSDDEKTAIKKLKKYNEMELETYDEEFNDIPGVVEYIVIRIRKEQYLQDWSTEAELVKAASLKVLDSIVSEEDYKAWLKEDAEHQRQSKKKYKHIFS